MLIKHARVKLSVILALVAVTCFTTSALAQNTAARKGGPNKGVNSIQFTASGETSTSPVVQPTPETMATAKGSMTEPNRDTVADAKKPVPESTPGAGDLEADIAAMKAENAAVKEQLRRMEESQRILIEQLSALRLRLDRSAAKDMSNANKPVGTPGTSDVSNGGAKLSPDDPQAAKDTVDAVAKVAAKQGIQERYQDGIVLWHTPDDAKVPLLLRFNVVTQLRYLNTLDSDRSFTDHLGVVREVHARNDITVNRSMFTLSGYIWDKRLQYSLLVWTANTFPYFTSTDRSMADNFFRPGFTQGVMASGEITKNLYYNAFIGNSLNTLSITANKIDTNLMGSGTVWWEPLGGYSEPGRSVNMYDDYFAQKKVRIRLGTSFTVSREDRFSNLDTSSPENTAIFNSDGVNAFATGAFAPGVTVQNATYKMWATDWGLKYNGLAINGQYFMRWLGDFAADGPLPLTSTFDHGYELSAGYFVVPKKLMVYGRGSGIFGQFKHPNEFGAGVKWHFLPTERLWLNFELMKVKGAAYNGAFSPYTSGMNGWVPMIQSVIAF